MPMFPNPPPTLDPPRLVRNDLNISVPWNSNQQSYVARERERNDHVKQVRKRLGKNETSAGAPATHQGNISNHQPSNVPQSSYVPQSPPRPVIGNLQPAKQNQNEPGLQQPFDHLQVKKATKKNPVQLEPLIQKGFLNPKQSVSPAAPIRTPAFDPT